MEEMNFKAVLCISAQPVYNQCTCCENCFISVFFYETEKLTCKCCLLIKVHHETVIDLYFNLG